MDTNTVQISFFFYAWLTLMALTLAVVSLSEKDNKDSKTFLRFAFWFAFTAFAPGVFILSWWQMAIHYMACYLLAYLRRRKFWMEVPEDPNDRVLPHPQNCPGCNSHTEQPVS